MNFASLPHGFTGEKKRMARGISLEMNWLPVQARKGCPLGLKNLGNSCYLNSVLQCLTYTPPLANFCLQNHHSASCCFSNGSESSICLFCLVEKRISRSLNIDSTSESPARIYSCLSLFAKHFRQGWQEDAHEFLRYVIEACNNVCVKLHKILSASKLRTRQDSQKLLKEEPHTVVKEIFCGILQSQVKCLSCKAESNKLDEIMDLSLDVFKLASLKDALCRFFQSEVLDGSNKYKCEKCKKLTVARKQMSVSQAPNVLVIQLKRFENFYGGKIDRHIIFEEDLELHAHMCRESQDQRPEYHLYGVIVHAGCSQDNGHYYSYVKDRHGKWFCCNDAHVTSVTVKSVLSEKAYVLFYVRKSNKSAANGSGVLENGLATDTAKENGKVAASLKGLSEKENGVTQKLNVDNVAKSSSVQQVRFNIVRSGLNGVNRKVIANKHGLSGDVPKDLLLSKKQSDLSSVSSDSNKPDTTNSVAETALLNKLELDRRSPSISDVNRPQGSSFNDNSRTLSVINESVPSSGAFFLSDNGYTKRLSNGSCSGSCHSEEGINHCSHGSISQPASVQKEISACLVSNDCERKVKLDESVLDDRVTAKALDLLAAHSLEGINKPVSTSGKISTMNGHLEGSMHVDLEFRLAVESREWLLQSGWCDTVRASFRQLKRARLSQNDHGNDNKRKTLGIEVFASAHDSLRQEVPKELKEHLVKQLQDYFTSQKLENI